MTNPRVKIDLKKGEISALFPSGEVKEMPILTLDESSKINKFYRNKIKDISLTQEQKDAVFEMTHQNATLFKKAFVKEGKDYKIKDLLINKIEMIDGTIIKADEYEEET